MTDAAKVASSEDDALPSQLRRRFAELNLEPLWESKHSHKLENGVPDDGQIWAWKSMRPIMIDVGEVSSPKVVERRVLTMLDPRGRYRDGEGSVGCMNATMQMLKPGEQARPHRHTMNALRFVLESSGGAKTIVDGKECPMEPGDLVLTPGWTWHTHKHDGRSPVIWLDVLDVSLHRYLGVELFQPGPITDTPEQLDDSIFASPNMPPITDYGVRDYSPVFRYPWADAARAIAAAPINRSGVRRIRYANPLTGGESMSTLDSTLIQVDPGMASKRVTVTADAVFCVVEGEGAAEIGETRRTVSKNDVFTVPAKRPFRFRAEAGAPLRLFTVSNGPVFRKLGLLTVQIDD